MVLLIHLALDTYNESLFHSLINETQGKIFFFTFEKEADSVTFTIDIGKKVFY